MSEETIYFIRAVGQSGPIKIGKSSFPKRRLMELTVWSPVPLEIIATCPGGYALEHNLHECFQSSHSHLEWFHASAKLLACVEALKRGEPIERAVDLTDRKKLDRTPRKKVGWTPERRTAQSCVLRISAAERRASRILGRDVIGVQSVRSIQWDVASDGTITDGARALLDAFCADPIAVGVKDAPWANRP